MFYSASRGGFYAADIHSTMPEDVVEIGVDEWRKLLRGQSEGKVIVANERGLPVLKERPVLAAQDAMSLTNRLASLGIDIEELSKAISDLKSSPSHRPSRAKSK